jgi:hypothetical protein
MGSTNGRAWTWTKKAPSVFPRFRTLDSRFSRDPGAIQKITRFYGMGEAYCWGFWDLTGI